MALGTPFSLGSVAYAGANVPSVQVTPVQTETQAQLVTTAAVAAGSLVVVAVAFDVAQPAVVVTDSAGNVYGKAPDAWEVNVFGLVVEIYSCTNGKALPAGSTIAIALPGASGDSPSGIVPAAVPAPNYLFAAAAAVTGVAAPAALDATAIATGSGTAPSSGNAATGTAAEVLFGAIGWERTSSPGSAESITWGGSFTALADAEAQNGSSGRAGLFFGYRVVTSASAYAAAGTLGNSDQWTAAICGYRAESDFGQGSVWVNGAPLASGRTGYTPSASVNRIEIRGLVDFDGMLYTDANAQPQLQINNAAASSVLSATSMDYRSPGAWGLDVADSVWVHAAGPWACVLTVENAAVTKLLATYRFTTSDPQN